MTPRGCSCPHPSLSPAFPLAPRIPSSPTSGSPIAPLVSLFGPPHPTPQLQVSGLCSLNPWWSAFCPPPTPPPILHLPQPPGSQYPVCRYPFPILPPSDLHLCPPPTIPLAQHPPVPLTHSPQGMDNEAGGRGRGWEGETPRDISAGGRGGEAGSSPWAGIPSHEVGNLASWQG